MPNIKSAIKRVKVLQKKQQLTRSNEAKFVLLSRRPALPLPNLTNMLLKFIALFRKSWIKLLAKAVCIRTQLLVASPL